MKLPETEEEAICLINDLRIKTSKPGQAFLIDPFYPLHLLPLRSENDYAIEIAWRSLMLAEGIER